jgi:Large eukaryotic DNA virus major capsid protein/Major capsid protein N-terminus
MADFTRPKGTITTLLDLTPRDEQDAHFFPLGAETTWFQSPSQRTLHPFTLSLQQFPLRGPASWGQRVTFDIGSVNCGDLLLSTTLQLQLGHWFDPTTLQNFLQQSYLIGAAELPTWWWYANSLGSIIIERAELEIGDTTIETIDGDFIHVFSSLFPSLNTSVGSALDTFGRLPLLEVNQRSAFPISTPYDSTLTPGPDYYAVRPYLTEQGKLLIPLPFFYQRVKLQEALPLLAINEGNVRIHITFRNFTDCIRQYRGFRDSCTASPLGQKTQFYNFSAGFPFPIPSPLTSYTALPQFQQVQLMTYAAVTDGSIRQKLLRSPFEILYREVKCIHFAEPLKYTVTTSSSDIISIQLPLELNHPIEEILWFVRRKEVANNNEWTNYSATLTRDYDSVYSPFTPLLKRAKLQVNGIDIIEGDEHFFRTYLANRHKGGVIGYSSFVYGYSFTTTPGIHQPQGTINASRASSIRLCLDVAQPTLLHPNETAEWEVKVFVFSLQWLRFQDGLANRMFAS